jgi:hypothetical protein
MPKGPKGEKRPADAIGNAVMIGRIATGEIEDITTEDGSRGGAGAHGRKSAGGVDDGRAAQGNCQEGSLKTLRAN